MSSANNVSGLTGVTMSSGLVPNQTRNSTGPPMKAFKGKDCKLGRFNNSNSNE